MIVNIQATNFELTPQWRSFVEEKLNDSLRAFGDMNLDPVTIDLELERTTRRYRRSKEDQQLYRAEANVELPGQLIRAEGSADDLRKAIVKMKKILTTEIRRWRERLITDRRKGSRAGKRVLHEFDDVDDDLD